jgi:hypothetical protein
MVTFNSDFTELLAEFNAHHVEYIVVGPNVLAAHGQVRATKDLDVWVSPEPANAARVVAALRAFGAALHGLTEEDMATPGVVFQMGIAPVVSTSLRASTVFASKTLGRNACKPSSQAFRRPCSRENT